MIGEKIQNFKIDRLLGEGGMGRVYLATDELLGRTVAIKNLNAALPGQPQFLERFKNEAKTLARLSHPNIAMLYNYLHHNNDYYIVMEYVEGKNLDQLLRDHKTLPYHFVVPLITQTLSGLAHAHKKNILHRDIKPTNIMLSDEDMVKLMDFGIAKVSDSAKLTQASRVIGTIEFLAPELIEGKEPSIASDIYAIGVTMYELLTGKLPFTGKSDYMLMQDIVKEKPINLQRLNTSIPKKLSEIVLKALEKNPEKRFRSATELSAALGNAFPELEDASFSLIQKAEALPTKVLPAMPVPIDQSGPATSLHQPLAATELAEKKPLAKNLDLKKHSKKIVAAAMILAVMVTCAFVFLPKQSQPVVPVASNNDLHDEVPDNSISDPLYHPQPALNQDSIYQIISQTTNGDAHTPIPAPASVQAEGNSSSQRKPTKEKENDRKVTPGPAQNTEPDPAPQPQPKPAQEETVSSSITSTIRLRVNAMIALRENLTMESAKEGQSVSFRVTEPVIYKNDVLFPAGSVINGSIKGIGSKRIAIIFHSVMAGGKRYSLEKSESGGWKEDVLNQGNAFKVGLRGTLVP